MGDLGDKKLKDLLFEWQGKIKSQRESFIANAERISEWDTGLRKATAELRQLELEVEELEQESLGVQASLDGMISGQEQLDKKLNAVEARFKHLPSIQAGSQAVSTFVGNAMAARRDAYDAAIELSELLDALDTALTGVETQMKDVEANSQSPVRFFFSDVALSGALK